MAYQNQQDSAVVNAAADWKDCEGANVCTIQAFPVGQLAHPVSLLKAEEAPLPAANRMFAYAAIAATVGIVFGLTIASLAGPSIPKNKLSASGLAISSTTVLAAEIKPRSPVETETNLPTVELPPVQTPTSIQSSPLRPSPLRHKMAKKKVPDVPGTFAIEGDDELVGFDQSNGIIQTNARKTFLVAVASIGGNSSAWQQWPANIHYKCDLNASCMLTRRGATVLHAQLKK